MEAAGQDRLVLDERGQVDHAGELLDAAEVADDVCLS